MRGTVLGALSGVADGIRAAIEGGIRARVRRLTVRAAALLVALVFAAIGLGMLAWAAFLALSIVYGAPIAALIVAGAAFLVAGLIALVTLRTGSGASGAQAAPQQAPLSTTDIADRIEASAEDIERIGRTLNDLAARHGGSLVVGALAAGLVIGLTRPPRR